MNIQEVKRENFKAEYGILCHRVYPNEEINTPFGSTWCIVEVGKRTDPHNHEVGETFFILEGQGNVSINEETSHVKKGAVVYIPPFSKHVLTNTSPSENLVFLSVWWDSSLPGALE